MMCFHDPHQHTDEQSRATSLDQLANVHCNSMSSMNFEAWVHTLPLELIHGLF